MFGTENMTTTSQPELPSLFLSFIKWCVAIASVLDHLQGKEDIPEKTGNMINERKVTVCTVFLTSSWCWAVRDGRRDIWSTKFWISGFTCTVWKTHGWRGWGREIVIASECRVWSSSWSWDLSSRRISEALLSEQSRKMSSITIDAIKREKEKEKGKCEKEEKSITKS